jgi:nucleoside-diphosphate-sugar epimerase
MPRTILLVGPGWLGAPTASALAATGAEVITMHRSAGAAPAGCRGVTGRLENAAQDSVLLSALPRVVDDLVVTVAPSRTRGDSYDLYPAAAAGAVALASRLGVRSILWVSSTGVYDRQDGSEVSERTPIRPHDARVQALFDAEQCILGWSSAGSATDGIATAPRVARVLRAAGLYGPGRDPANRFIAGTTPPDIWCNFSWRDDVRDAMLHLLVTPPATSAEVFNCADGHPVQAREITRALTGDVPEAATVSRGITGAVRSGRSNQRVRVDALLATGWSPAMPTVFDGLRALGHTIA